jgi:hypothetical protein
MIEGMDIHIPGTARPKPLEIELQLGGPPQTSGGLTVKDIRELLEYGEALVVMRGAPDTEQQLNKLDSFRASFHYRFDKSCEHNGTDCPYPPKLLAKRLQLNLR